MALYPVIGKICLNAEQCLEEFERAYTLLIESGEKAAYEQQDIDLINTP